MKNTIVLKGKGIKSEFLCKEDIYPGMLVELAVDSGVIKLQKNTNANNLKETCFMTEYEAFGKTILDKAEADGTAHVYFANAGDVIYARVDSTVVVGDKLVSNGDGTLKKASDVGLTLSIGAAAGDNVAGTVTLTDGTITAGTITAGTITAGENLTGENLTGTVTSNEGNITDGTITDGDITGGTITAGTITVGTISTSLEGGATIAAADIAAKLKVNGNGTESVDVIGYGITAMALEAAEKVADDVYFAKVIIL